MGLRFTRSLPRTYPSVAERYEGAQPVSIVSKPDGTAWRPKTPGHVRRL